MLRSLSRIRLIMLTLIFSAAAAVAITPSAAYAVELEGEDHTPVTQNPPPPQANPDATEVDVCRTEGNDACNRFIDTYINPLIYLLSGLVGVVAVISLIFAGIQYSASADDPGTVTKAKQRIFQTIIGLVAYIFLFALLEYLVPGGLYG